MQFLHFLLNSYLFLLLLDLNSLHLNFVAILLLLFLRVRLPLLCMSILEVLLLLLLFLNLFLLALLLTAGTAVVRVSRGCPCYSLFTHFNNTIDYNKQPFWQIESFQVMFRIPIRISLLLMEREMLPLELKA